MYCTTIRWQRAVPLPERTLMRQFNFFILVFFKVFNILWLIFIRLVRRSVTTTRHVCYIKLSKNASKTIVVIAASISNLSTKPNPIVFIMMMAAWLFLTSRRILVAKTKRSLLSRKEVSNLLKLSIVFKNLQNLPKTPIAMVTIIALISKNSQSSPTSYLFINIM